MTGFLEIVLIILGVGLLGGLAWFAWKMEQKKREAFAAWAQSHGWTYDWNQNRDIAQRYAFLDRLQSGANRYAVHCLAGEWRGHPAEAFTFHFETYSHGKHGRTTHHHYFAVVLFHLEQSFPELCIHPEGLFAKFGQMLGFDDIDFESVEFSKAFSVRSEDKKLAYDFCHTGMMEHLLQHPKTALELEGSVLALYDKRSLKPDDIEHRLDQLHQVRTLIPDFLFRD
ncbi:MAG: hypothetical protein VX916_01500 [Planctomycetota bacterium]|nr:hypothetical protein [Planctomycetota bacterium]